MTTAQSDNDDAFLLERERLLPTGHRREMPHWRPPHQRLFVLATAGVCLLGLGTILLMRGIASNNRSPQPAMVASPTVTPVYTLTPGKGWTASGPSWAQRITFAPSSPLTAYVCGVPSLGNSTHSAPVVLGRSQDGGHSWQASPTPVAAVGCDLTVDPVDASDLFLIGNPCPSCSPLPDLQLYRSLDGGRNWTLWTTPSNGADGTQHFSAYLWDWVGDSFFLAPYSKGELATTHLIVSRSGQAFAEVSATDLYTSVPSDAAINALLGTATALYVELLRPPDSGCVSDCETIKRTVDGGISWTLFNPQFHGQPLNLLATGSDGKTLLGSEQRTAVRSLDDGGTWQALPVFPGKLTAIEMLESPDRTIVALLFSDEPQAPPGVYVLVPGATAWRFLSAFPSGNNALVMSWDHGGHPTALWGGVYRQSEPGVILPGIEYVNM